MLFRSFIPLTKSYFATFSELIVNFILVCHGLTSITDKSCPVFENWLSKEDTESGSDL